MVDPQIVDEARPPICRTPVTREQRSAHAEGRADEAEHREADIEHSETIYTPEPPVDMQASSTAWESGGVDSGRGLIASNYCVYL